MNNAEIKALNVDIEIAYKKAIQPLYLKWRQLSSNQVSEMFAFWIVRHNHQKILELVNRRRHRKLKFQKVKTELEMCKVKKELENYVEEL